MKKITLIFFVFVFLMCIPGSHNLFTDQDFGIKLLYQSVHDEGLGLHFIFFLPYQFDIEIGYGYYLFNSVVGELKYKLDFDYLTPYLFVGYGLFFNLFKNDAEYYVHTLNMGIGYSVKFAGNFFLYTDLCIIKYLRHQYYFPGYSFEEEFDYDEEYYPQIGIGIGFNFTL